MIRRWTTAAVLCSLLVACSKSNDPPTTANGITPKPAGKPKIDPVVKPTTTR